MKPLFVLLLATCLNSAAATGTASWYGFELANRPMANGKPFDPSKLTCASWHYPLGTRLRVSNKNKSVFVTVTDRGPARRLGRIIDLSRAAFQSIEELDKGLVTVRIEEIK